jgi:hypothetical protein
MAKKAAVTDEILARALGLYAGMVDHILTEPQRWLGLDEDPPPTASFPVKALDALHDRAFGDITPASPRWSDQPRQSRIDWWVRRIAVSAGLAAAAPRLAGALADRIPLQAALGASATGLAVCATAREQGVSAVEDWVPLLARVLFDRDLSVPAPVPPADQTEQELAASIDETPASPDAGAGTTSAPRRAASTLWRLARTFYELQGLLDNRPRGGILARAIAKAPVVGIAGGWLDERGAIRKASRETSKLIAGTAV